MESTSTKNVLVLGAGRVARPAVAYLLEQPGFRVTLADREAGRAAETLGRVANGRAVVADLADRAAMSGLIREAAVVVSLLPPDHHVAVAEMCLEHRRPLLTTSYVSPGMRALDGRAREAGVLLLNELGLDPGIDHMSARQIIDAVRQGGGKVRAFRSACGGLPAPDANDNPWGYKFSWSPLGVLRACGAPARFMQDGRVVELPSGAIFDRPERVDVDGVGALEAYPNRDSLVYAELYGLDHAHTVLRATLRYPGWCETLRAVMAAGLLDASPRTWPAGATLADLTRSVLSRPAGNVRRDLAIQLTLSEDAEPIRRLQWLGLFENVPLPAGAATRLEAMAARMQDLMSYGPNECDMIVLRHEFVVERPGEPLERITATLVNFGVPGGDSAMSRTVGLPVAIGARLVAEGRIMDTGVHIPVAPHLYNPVLSALAERGVHMQEQREPA